MIDNRSTACTKGSDHCIRSYIVKTSQCEQTGEDVGRYKKDNNFRHVFRFQLIPTFEDQVFSLDRKCRQLCQSGSCQLRSLLVSFSFALFIV